MIWAVVLAGGEGTRFWPRSRRDQPKPFHSFLGKKTLLEETVRRLSPMIPPHRIVVVTHRRYLRWAHKLLAKIPKRNILGEPEAKNTAPSVALAAGVIENEDPEAILVILPSDHHILEGPLFRSAIQIAAAKAEAGLPVTLGIRPQSAHPGYGYLRCGRKIAVEDRHSVFEGTRFVEKPSRTRAQRLLRTGGYLWNSGIFAFRLNALKALMRSHLSQVAKAFERIQKFKTSEELSRQLRPLYRRIPEVSIDRGLMEKLPRFYVVETRFSWTDLGTWCEIEPFLVRDGRGNRVEGKVVSLRSARNLVQGDRRLIALLGVEDLIIVDSEDALLICAKKHAQEVRRLVARLKKLKLSRYL